MTSHIPTPHPLAYASPQRERESHIAAAPWALRTSVRPADSAAVRAIVASTGFFSDAEIDVAVELIDDRLAKGPKSDYHFMFADQKGADGGPAIGYACYGEIACTVGSYDLYWIAVHNDHRGGGLGRKLMDEAERDIAQRGGRRVYVETSSRAQYEPTRAFYLKCGYHVDATLEDFYAPGDGKVILVKAMG
jgi:D-alanine-D-alanine ligase